MFIKRFLEWIGVKENLHKKQHKPPHVSEGEIWWASVGENIGWEMNGKSKLFTRPVIIYKKLASGFYFVIPLTSKDKKGSWFVNFKLSKRAHTACLHQARAIDYRRLFSKFGELDSNDFTEIKRSFKDLYQ